MGSRVLIVRALLRFYSKVTVPLGYAVTAPYHKKMSTPRLESFEKAILAAIRNTARSWYRNRSEFREAIPLTFTINGKIKLYNPHGKINDRV